MILDWKLNRILARRDTRSLAREWIVQNIPPGPIAASEPRYSATANRSCR